MHLGYIIIYVPNVLSAVEFYEKAFGVSRRSVHVSTRYAEMETGATVLAFADEAFVASASHAFRQNRPGEMPAGAEVSFVTDDVSAAFHRAVEAGAAGAIKPMTIPSGQVVACVRDLNGFVVQLCSNIDKESAAVSPAQASTRATAAPNE
jgi:predicted enzyme related to lactoylglutathione lyase